MVDVKLIRTRQGVTKKACSKALGVSNVTYSKYEREPAKMSVAKCIKLANFLHVDPSEFFLDTN